MKIRLSLFLLALGLLALWLAACGPQPLPEEPTPIPTLIPATMPAAPTSSVQATSNPAQAGMEVFSQHCSACHNITAEAKVGPGLQGLFDLEALPNGSTFSEDNLRDWIRSGGGAMPGVSLSDQDMDILIEYLRQATHVGGTVVTPVPQPPADAADNAGAEIFNTNCAVCHTLTEQTLVGPGLAGLFDRELPNGEGVNKNNLADWIRSGGGAMPSFPLADDQMEILVEYLQDVTKQ
jgi:mono/diheme cytochrome c family protein